MSDTPIFDAVLDSFWPQRWIVVPGKVGPEDLERIRANWAAMSLGEPSTHLRDDGRVITVLKEKRRWRR